MRGLTEEERRNGARMIQKRPLKHEYLPHQALLSSIGETYTWRKLKRAKDFLLCSWLEFLKQLQIAFALKTPQILE